MKAMGRVEPSVVTNSVLYSLTVCYIRFLHSLYATAEIDQD